MELFYPVDRAILNNLNPSIPLDEIKYLNDQMNCNLEWSDENETWFDQDTWPDHVSIVDEIELFNRDIECDT